MDATQLTLYFNSRPQVSAKPTPQLGDDPLGADQAFASMLQKSLTESSDQQRQLEQERQNWRNQPSSYTASQPPQAPAAPTSDASGSQPADKTPSPSRGQDSSTKSTTTTAATSSQKTSDTGDKTSATSSGTTDKSNDSATKDAKGTKGAKDTKDANQSADDQAASATGHPTTGKQDAHHHHQLADGDDKSGGGQNQGQNPQDGKPQQSAADGETPTATVEGIESTVLAGLLTGQPPAPAGGAGAQAASSGGKNTALGLPIGTKSQAGGTSGQAAVPAQNGSNTAATPVVPGLAPGLTIPGPGASAVGTTPGQASAGSANGALPQAATALATETHATATPDLDTTFANIIAKKTAPAASDSDKLHISVTKTGQDSAPQMPRPLVRVNDNQPTQPSIQPVPALTEDATVSAANNNADFDSNLDQQDYGIDSLRAFGSLNTMLPGASLAGVAKQADMMTALRQQLATASLQDQVAIHMQRAAGNNVDKISIQLSPEELGRIHVKMSVDDDKQVSATITVERPATLDMLQRDTKALERALQDAGLKTGSGSLSFSLQQGNQGDSSGMPGWGQNGGRQAGSSGQEKTAAAAEVSSSTAKNAVDTANGLVDVAV